MGLLKYSAKIVILPFFLILILSSCKPGWWDPGDARKISPDAEVRARKAIAEGKGVSINRYIKGEIGGGGNFSFASSNPLWRASLEVLESFPLANVDYAGGLIITDWIDEGISSEESIKIMLRFLSNEIRADGLKVIVFKRVCKSNSNCVTKKISSNIQEEVKFAVLRKATLIEKNKNKNNTEEFEKQFGKIEDIIERRKNN